MIVIVEHEALLKQLVSNSPSYSDCDLQLPHDDRLWRARSPGFNHATSPYNL